MKSPLLDIQNLSIQLNRKEQLVNQVNIKLGQGETVAVVGESGSGKTLISLAIMQLLPLGLSITENSAILLEQQDLLTFSEIEMRKVRGKKIALVFQEAITAFNPIMTIGNQIMEVLSIHFQLSATEKQLRMLDLLHEVGFPDPHFYQNAYPHRLSGGLKQRAMIAQALAGEPQLLIADEPTTALDVTLQAQIIRLLKDIQKKRNMGLIFITHDLGVVYEIADQVIVLYKGQVVEHASAHQFFQSPTHPYSYKLFASLPGWVTPSQEQTVDTKTILKIDQLKVYYPIKKGLFKRTVGYVEAVDDISLSLAQGKTLALVGESGSGKTTVSMAILKLVEITAGTIYFNGYNLAHLNQQQLNCVRNQPQVVFQDPYGSMNPRMLVKDIIAEGMHFQKRRIQDQETYVNQLLEDVGLDPAVKNRYPHEFSGGQRQRICIARALAVEPKLLVCDEPTSALDVSVQMQILQLLLDLQQKKNLAYLLITHNIAVVEFMANEVAVMHHGKIVECGLVKDVLYSPQHPYTKELLNAVPTVPKWLRSP